MGKLVNSELSKEGMNLVNNRCVSRRKDRERFLLEQFLQASNLKGEILEEREAPDFIIRVDQDLVGVEVTELFIHHGHRRETPQAQEAISTQITVKAQRLYQLAGGPPAHVTLCFGPGRDLRGLNREKAAQALCDYVLDLNLALWQRVDWRPEDCDFDGPLPDEVSFVHALGVPSYEMAHWGVARAGWVASLNAATLQERIEAKGKRLPSYSNVVAENWLLIVADATNPSSAIEARDDFDPTLVITPFGRTFFYQYPCKILELGVE